MEQNQQEFLSRNPQEHSYVENPPPVSLREWMITFLITSLPIIGLIMLFVWGFSEDTNPNKAAWAKATLLWMVIIFALYFLVMLVVVAIVGSSVGELMSY